MNELERLSQAHAALAEARTLEEVKAILDVAVAAKVYARARDLGEESARYAQEVVNRATRRMGELLATAEKHPGAAAPRSNELLQRPRLADLGVTRMQSSRAQSVARLPEADFERLADKPQNRLLRIQRDRESDAKRQRRGDDETASLQNGTSLDIRHGDFRDVLADLENVNAVITDPPYPKEYLPLLGDLATWADKVLAPDGVLAVLFGQSWLPEVYRQLDTGRPYRWTACYLTPGAGYVSMGRAVQSNWKPVLIYGAGRRFADVFRTEAQDASAKDRHHWGQDYGAFCQLVGALTDPGQTVVDPFMGSGTTLLAAKTQGRHAIGCDVDLTHVENARKWLA